MLINNLLRYQIKWHKLKVVTKRDYIFEELVKLNVEI